ncbi:unnamed protein product [Pedinophyceae sp. YPF-701]|nr:unnamed protein product [Pedinophyceae sp. YPF-701]
MPALVHKCACGRVLAAPAPRAAVLRASRSLVIANATTDTGVEIPGSKRETLQQVSVSLTRQLVGKNKASGKAGAGRKASRGKKKAGKAAGGRAKGFTNVSTKKLVVEIPGRDVSAEGNAKLACDMLEALPEGAAPDVSLVCCGGEVSEPFMAGLVERLPDLEVLSLTEAMEEPPAGDVLVLSAPSVGDLRGIEEVLGRFRGAAVVALNPEWTYDVPAEYRAMVRSFKVLYAFAPLAIQGFLGNKEGVILKAPGDASPESTPFRVFLREGGESEYRQVGQMARRPTPSDIEQVVYNAAAASSTVVKAAKGISSLFGRKKDDK